MSHLVLQVGKQKEKLLKRSASCCKVFAVKEKVNFSMIIKRGMKYTTEILTGEDFERKDQSVHSLDPTTSDVEKNPEG